MKTIFYKLLSVTLFLFLFVTNLRAYDFEADGIYYNIIDTEKVDELMAILDEIVGKYGDSSSAAGYLCGIE